MRTLGMIGGLGPEATLEYYRLLVDIYRERKPDGNYPQVLINSIDLQPVIALVTANDRAGLVVHLERELQRLARAGADIALIAANTPHIVFDELQRVSPLPLISIVEAACGEAQRRGLKRVGLFGTCFTMQAGFYQATFQRAGIEIVVPSAVEQEIVHEKYMGELVNGIFLDETRARLFGIMQEMQRREGIEAVILGGTELPLLFRAAQGIPMLDTGRIHVEEAVRQMLS